MRTEARAETRGNDVVCWRRRQLVTAGFEPGIAARLASDRRVDLHALIELVERGCPAQLAVRILAPLDADGPTW